MKTGFTTSGRNPRRRTRGTALLLALLVILAATFTLGGWAMVLAARVQSTEAAVQGIQRRLAIQNSRNIGMQWARNSYQSNSISGVSVVLANNWGQFVAANATNNILSVTNTMNTLNHFGPMGSGGFSAAFVTTLSTTNLTVTNVFHFRSRSPFFAGYPLLAQSNLTSTDLGRIEVATNDGGNVLMYAGTDSTNNAPAALTYNSFTNRLVVSTLGGSTPVSPSSYPYVPTISAIQANAYNGSLNVAPTRSPNLNALESTLQAAYGTNVPVVNDTLGDFRIIGTTNGYGLLSTNITRSGTTRRFLFVNTIPNSTLTTSRLEFGTFTGNNRFNIESNNGWPRIRRGSSGSWTSLNNMNNYLSVNSSGQIQNLSRGNRFTIQDAFSTSMVIVPIDSDEIIALQGSHITVEYPGTGIAQVDNPDIVEGAVVFQRAFYGANNGVFFFLLGNPRTLVARNLMQVTSPDNGMRIRALVNGLPLVQIQPNTYFEIDSDSANNTEALGFQANQSHKFQIRANTTATTPLFLHVQQTNYVNQNGSNVNTGMWRRVLMVVDPDNPLNINAAGSALTFSYLDDADFDMSTATGENTRPVYLSVQGNNSNISDVNFLGGTTNPWTLGMTFFNADVTFSPASGTSGWTIRGGLRTNRDVQVPNNMSLILRRNTTPSAGALEAISDRVGWIETWQQ